MSLFQVINYCQGEEENNEFVQKNSILRVCTDQLQWRDCPEKKKNVFVYAHLIEDAFPRLKFVELRETGFDNLP